MKKIFYPRLAATNIKKNGKLYFPYILTCIITVAMFYIMCSITFNPGINEIPNSAPLFTILVMGIIVVGLFATIFLFYTNSFLIKRRKKEFGLFNILGMEKRHIARLMLFETLITALCGIVGGLICGIVFDRLITLLLFKMMDFTVPMKFIITPSAIFITAVLFAGIFLLILLSNFAKISLSKPIELLHGSNSGEKEPKTKWLLAIFGFLCIGTGYTIAIVTESPLDALALFFIAVVLVIIGTYCLFTAGSIAVLKMLRNNKKYYYKTSHFTNVSGMLYRMKQNAVGLANICILSTMVLVMVSTTVSLYIGVDDALDYRFPTDVSLTQYLTEDINVDRDGLLSTVDSVADRHELNILDERDYKSLSVTSSFDGERVLFDNHYASSSTANIFFFTTKAEYERATGNSLVLDGNCIAIYDDPDNKYTTGDKIIIGDETYPIVSRLDSFPVNSSYLGFMVSIHYVVLADDSTLSRINLEQKQAYGNYSSNVLYTMEFNLDGTDEQKIDCFKDIATSIASTPSGADEQSASYRSVYAECKQDTRTDFYSMYGGLFFLGVFLGLLFLMATVLIIYYKQISEGYDDKERFRIMEQVGMSRAEVKKTIRSQVLTVFFLPIVAAGIHLLASFKMITKLLAVMNLTNVGLFAVCTIVTVLIFSLIYAIVYALTAKVYYKIVE